ncbi:hypothetical protein E8E14_012770 [Neopestalotiopsis sp. 37M]|nr:hypothetical protein E8E14_012770 [Neopestalotiopsis sp. 37M]
MAVKPSKRSNVAHVDRIHFHQARAAQRFLSSQHLNFLREKYFNTFGRNLQQLDSQSTDTWVEYPDLYAFLQTIVSTTAVEVLMGSKLLEMNPSLIEDFWRFDMATPWLLRGWPRWLIPSAYQARDRILNGIKKWHAHAHANTDCTKIMDEDPEWEPYFGSKLIRARQEYALKMKLMDSDARASEDLGLIMAANANVVPSVFWFLYEALRDYGLKERLISEINACHGPSGFDTSKLIAKPLLQSAYAETLRLRVANGMFRQSESEPFDLDGYRIPKGEPMIIFTRHPSLNEESWASAGRPSTDTPLDQFQADRFLVPNDTAEENSNGEKMSQSELGGGAYKFSMEGLAGLWLPYGGGQRMCPGRHFAKAEIINTLALLLSQYDFELVDTETIRPKPDVRWFPTGGLPPDRKVPFRMRRRSKTTYDIGGW